MDIVQRKKIEADDLDFNSIGGEYEDVILSFVKAEKVFGGLSPYETVFLICDKIGFNLFRKIQDYNDDSILWERVDRIILSDDEMSLIYDQLAGRGLWGSSQQ